MGWTFTDRPSNARAYLRDCCYTCDNDEIQMRVLDDALVSFTEYYALVEITNKRTQSVNLIAGLAMIRFTRDAEYNFGYKACTEDSGMYLFNCPARIFDRLTPTTNDRAIEWRERVLETKNNRCSKTYQVGDLIKFDSPILFVGGDEIDTFEVVKYRSKAKRFTRPGSRYGMYNISNVRSRRFRILGSADFPQYRSALSADMVSYFNTSFHELIAKDSDQQARSLRERWANNTLSNQQAFIYLKTGHFDAFEGPAQQRLAI